MQQDSFLSTSAGRFPRVYEYHSGVFYKHDLPENTDISLSTALSESKFAWLSLSLAFHHISKLKTRKPSLLASGEQ